MWKALWQLPAAVWLLGLVSFFNDAASEMIYPLVPLYLASVLMAGPRTLGLIEGIAEATGSLLKLFSGVMVDYHGKSKAWVVGGYSLAALCRPLFALAASWPMVLVLRFADRVGKGLRTSPRDALLAASLAPAQRGLGFGLQRALDNAGGVAGPLLAALLLAWGVGLRDIFWWTIVPGVVAVGLALSLREPAAPVARPSGPLRWRMGAELSGFKRYLVVVGLFTLGNSSNMFLLLRAQELGLPEYQVALLWAVVSGSAALFSVPLSGLSDRLGRMRVITAGWTLYGLFYLALGALNPSGWMLWGYFAVYGLCLAATEGAEKALVADFAPPAWRGTAYGWFHLVSGLMLFPASLLFGWLWQAAGALTAFAFAAACAWSSALLLRYWVKAEAVS